MRGSRENQRANRAVAAYLPFLTGLDLHGATTGEQEAGYGEEEAGFGRVLEEARRALGGEDGMRLRCRVKEGKAGGGVALPVADASRSVHGIGYFVLGLCLL